MLPKLNSVIEMDKDHMLRLLDCNPKLHSRICFLISDSEGMNFLSLWLVSYIINLALRGSQHS